MNDGTNKERGETPSDEAARVQRFVRQTVRVPCAIEAVKCLDHPDCDTVPAIHLRIGEANLGHVFFDDRYDDGKHWILNDHRKRFEKQKEAVDSAFQRLGLQCPAGFLDVCEKV